MTKTDYAAIAEALGISIGEARELESEHRRWRAALVDASGHPFPAGFAHR